MTIAPSGNAIGVQDAGSNPSITAQSTFCSGTITIGSATYKLRTGIHHGSPIGSGSTSGYEGIGGTVYGYSNPSGTGNVSYTLNSTGASAGIPLCYQGDCRNSNGYSSGPGSIYGLFPQWITGSVTYTNVRMGSYMSSDTFGSCNNTTWTADDGSTYELVQLLWMKNTQTSGTFPNVGSPNPFQGQQQTGDNDSNYVFVAYKRTDTFYSGGPPLAELTIGNQYYGGITVKPFIYNTQSASPSTVGSSGNQYGLIYGWYGFTDSQIDGLGTSGTIDFTIKGLTNTTTYNNGIAEEFGGNDSADVKMSDYYKGGTLVTSNVTASIPSTGNPISVSDFIGATQADAGFFNTTYNSDTSTTQLYTGTHINISGYRNGDTNATTDSLKTHTGTGEDSRIPTTTFTSPNGFLGLTSRTFTITQLSVNAIDNASSFEYSLGYVYDNFYLTLRTSGDLTGSGMSNTGWTDMRFWTGTDTYSNPTLIITRANTQFAANPSYFSGSGDNFTTVAINATQSQIGSGLKSGLTQGDYSDIFGTSTSAFSNPEWNFAIT